MISKNQIKYIRGLSLKKNRIKEQCFIVEGEKCLAELLNSSFEIIELFALKDWIDENKEVFDKVQAVSFKELERISNLRSPNKVVAVVKIKKQEIIQQKSAIILAPSTDTIISGIQLFFESVERAPSHATIVIFFLAAIAIFIDSFPRYGRKFSSVIFLNFINYFGYQKIG